MTWYAFHGYNNGQAINASAFDSTELMTLGFHGYATAAQAQKNPNSVPGFPNPLAVMAIPVVNAAIDDYNNTRDISPTIANNQSNPASAGQAAVNTFGGFAGGWLKGLGGDIGSGIESGVVSVLKDLWTVIYPALEILAGAVIIVLVLGFVFKDDLLGLLPLAAAAL